MMPKSVDHRHIDDSELCHILTEVGSVTIYVTDNGYNLNVRNALKLNPL